jgi:citrate lyase subunit alpha/citrate CoA-transferase
MTIEELRQRAVMLTGEPEPPEFTDRVVGIIRYRDGSVIDVVRQVKMQQPASGTSTPCSTDP